MSASSYPIAPNGLDTPHTQSSSVSAELAFSRRDWAITGLAALEAVLWVLVFDPCALFDHNLAIPGVGVTLCAVAGFACAYGLQAQRLRITRTTLFLNAAALLIALSFALFADQTLRVLNCLALWVIGTLALCQTTGVHERAWYSLSTLAAALGFFFSSLFSNLTKPLKAALIRLEDRQTHRTGQSAAEVLTSGVVVGIVLALASLVAVIPLLSSADVVFASLFEDGFRFVDSCLAKLDAIDFCIRCMFFVMVAPFLFALLYAVEHAERPVAQSRPHTSGQALAQRMQPITACIVIATLDVVYALFVVVQFVYLFGGSEAPAMHGGFAEYARSGFFQLVAVSVINIAFGLLAAKCSAAHTEQRAVLRVLTCLLIALSAVILASAAWRMNLYIGAYGLSLARLATLFVMVFCAVLFLTVLIELFAARAVFSRVFFTAGLVLWLAFTYVNPSGLVANYNAEAYLNGGVEQVDLYYLESLGPEGHAALQRLAEEAPEELASEARTLLTCYSSAYAMDSWQYFNLSTWLNQTDVNQG